MQSKFRPSIGVMCALAIAAIALLSTAVFGVLASHETSERLRHEIGADLAELATHMADKLDRGMFERWRDLQVAASLDTMRDPGVPLEAKRIIIDRMRSTYPDYAAIALIGPDGLVKAATVPQMVGASVATREFYLEGRKGPFAGDVHDAILLANILGNDPADPPRFVDVVAPVRADDGTLVGVLGAHLYWTWAQELERSLRDAARTRHPDIDILVLARDGTVLLGPKELHRKVLALDSVRDATSGRTGSKVEAWPDGSEYLTGFRRTNGYRDYPGLGWSVLVRQRAADSFAPVGEAQRRIAAWGGLVALVTGLLAWLAAAYVVRPLRALAGSAQALGLGQPIHLPGRAPREVAMVGDALATAASRLDDRDRRQTTLIHELNHRVKNTLATVQAMAVMTGRTAQGHDDYKAALQARIIALSKTHDLLTEAGWDAISLRDLLRNELAPYDDGSNARIVLEGPTIMLASRTAVALGMAAHELTTNAVKHGSLSAPNGCVAVRWELTQGAPGSRLHLVWRESNGPEVSEPSRHGFGSRLIKQGLARDLAGETHLDFAVSGLACTMLLSLDEPPNLRVETAPGGAAAGLKAAA